MTSRDYSVTSSMCYSATDYGNQAVVFKTLDNGDGTASPVMATMPQVPVVYNYNHQSAAGSYAVKTGAGILGRVIVNTPVTLSTVKIYDGTSASGNLIASISSIFGNQYDYMCAFTVGLFIVASLATDITVLYQ